jgi:DNA topoisomerase-1
MVIKSGRFGPYVTDGEVNATLRQPDDPQTVTPQRAAELLAEKRAQGPAAPRAKKTGRKKPAAKKSKAGTAKKRAAATSASTSAAE